MPAEYESNNPFSKQNIINFIIENDQQDPALTYFDLRDILFTNHNYINRNFDANVTLDNYRSQSNGYGALAAIADTLDYLLDDDQEISAISQIYGNNQRNWLNPVLVSNKLAFCLGDFYLKALLQKAGLMFDDHLTVKNNERLNDIAGAIVSDDSILF